MVTVRPETGEDIAAIRGVVDLAFGRADEGALVDALRAGGYARVSLVAIDSDAPRAPMIGHILFSDLPIEQAPGRPVVKALALAPISVHPAHQGRGVGAALMHEGLRAARAHGAAVVIVVGEPAYYGRFGFRADLAANLGSPFAGNPAFMAIELRPGALTGVRGRVRYAPPFGLG